MRGKRQYYIIYILLCCCLAFFAGIFVNRPVVADAASFASATLPEEVKSLFTDYTCTQLAAPTTLEEIATLKTKYSDATSTQYLSRAEQVILGHVKYTALREFSSQKNQIWQLGNLGNRLSSLNLRYPTSDLILTGIYGLTGQEIRVFVDANTNNLPQIIFTQNHGYWKGGYRSELTLQRGMNVFTYPTFVNSHIPENEIKGGAIYLKNNFNYAQQGDVKVYIEGGGFYPVFKKGEDENAFLDMLKEYEQKRLANQTSMLNLAELVTDHTIITTTSSSLYDNYIVNKTISPTINLELWGDFITQQLEFNGIATSPESHNNNWDEINNYININFRYMSVQPNSGAYTTNYHIGFYYEHDFFANFNTASVGDRNLFNMVHEVGHQIDTFRRKIDETTNNMNATYAYLMLLNKSPNSSWQPFDRSFEALSSDNSLNAEAFRDGHILYPATQINDRNYMLWWYLESVFPNFWADLNNIFRQDPATNLSEITKKWCIILR